VSKDSNPEFPILKRFQQVLKLSGLSERTQESYVRAVRKFSDFLKRQPDTASEDELRTYLLHIQDNLKWSPGSVPSVRQVASQRML
jgi:integrase/recombinase XerD